jgi:hypothetical protein
MAVMANFLKRELVICHPQVATEDAGVAGKMLGKESEPGWPASEASHQSGREHDYLKHGRNQRFYRFAQ